MSFGKRELNTRTSLQVIHLNSLTPQLDNNHHINLDAHHAQNLWITLGKVSFQIWPMHIYIYYTFTLWQTQNSYYTVNKVIYITEIDSYHLHCYKQTAAIISYSKKKKKEEQQFLYHVENSSTCSSLLYRWRFMEWGHKPTLLQAPSFSLKNS